MSSPLLVQPKSYLHNPDPEALRALVAKMPNAQETEFGNYMVTVKVKARSKTSTYIVDDNAKAHSDQTIGRDEYERMAALQDAYIAQQDMIVLDGYIGPNPGTRTATRLFMEQANANIAAMQQQLYFPVPESEQADFEPQLQVVYTPNLKAEGYPNDRLIAVDLEKGVTRVFNSDYFGESKKGGLRMWNQLVYEKGGLALHAGCKEIPVNGERKIGLIIGLSGTGKTTTTFTSQEGSKPIQDDFVGWLPSGEVIGSENGCFAKTFGLSADSEPAIHAAVTQRGAYLENVAVAADGTVDFFDRSYTENGRATFPLSFIEGVGNVHDIPKVDFILILNRNTNIIPAVAKLTHEQAAAFFMLGETQGTSAGGKEEAGKALRVPGTNPFFPGLHGQQGTRFLELLNNTDAQAYLMNTGWVGGPDGSPHSRKVKIRHSAAVVQGIASGTIRWEKDSDFGYEVASAVPGLQGEDEFLLRPRHYYEHLGQLTDYSSMVAALKQARQEYLEGYRDLDPAIIGALS